MDRTMPTARQRRNVPEEIRSQSGLARIDYVDLFGVAAPAARESSPEQWARAAIDTAAGAGGQFVWRGVLGLRLAARTSPDHVAGWTIAKRGNDWIRLEAASWFLTAHLVVRIDEDEASMATFIRYDRPPASLAWPRLARFHRRAMPGLLIRAARHVARERAR
jgi:hypothetical protein